MKDKRLLCWMIGVAAVGCGFAWTQIGKAGLFATPQPRVLPHAGQPQVDRGAWYSFQPQPRQTTPWADPDDDDEGGPRAEEAFSGLRKLSPEEINYLRYMELRGMRLTTEQPDRVTVKIPRQTLGDFLLAMQGDKDFDKEMARLSGFRGQPARQVFLRLTSPQKLHYIASHMGAAYADRVEITSDPEVFLDFKRSVMPIVIRSCGAAACHGSPDRDSRGFALFNDPKKSASTTYANFLMLNEMEFDRHHLIDRGQPDNSLLLTYMLPPESVKPEFRHSGEVTMKPVFRSPRALRYRRIRAWIASLKHPAEDYGIHFFPPPPPAAEPNDETQPPPIHRPEPEQTREPGQGQQGRPIRPASTPDSEL